MRGEALISTQRLMAEAVGAMAEHIANSTGYALTPVAFAELPANPQPGMIACVTDSTVNTWGAVIVPVVADVLGAKSVGNILAFYNGIAWTVAGK